MKDNKVLNFIIRHKAYVIIFFLVVIATLSTSFALFRLDIIGKNTYSLNVATPRLKVNEYEVSYAKEATDNILGVGGFDNSQIHEFGIEICNLNNYEVYFNYGFAYDRESLNVGFADRESDPQIWVLGANECAGLNLNIQNITDAVHELRMYVNVGFSDENLSFAGEFLGRFEEIILDSSCKDLPDTAGTPNPPELVGDMIPVTYDGTNWVKADTSNSSNSWYNYNTQEWANAVTVIETNRATYVAATPGTTIPMEDINTFMVWIPRYSYTMKDTYGVQGCGGDTPSVTTPGAFDIKFIDSNTTDLGTAEYTGDTVENWFTNSAFCWGNSCDDESTRSNPENRELSGIWVAKFESSTTDTTCTSSSSTANCNKILQPISLPSVKSWGYVDILNMFTSTQQYMNSTNGQTIYGLSGSTYDVHMMKNTEWGAVAYLTQSRYGKYGNEDYIGLDKEVAVNNCDSFITGISGDTVSASMSSSKCYTNTYNTEIGQSSSTTGNISGIYDMSGGANEYVMGNMQDSSGNFYASSSGFTTAPEAKYYNAYVYGSSSSDYTRYIKGDATKEMAGFYGDSKEFASDIAPWFDRGDLSDDNSSSGNVSFYRSFGIAFRGYGFRLTLVP